MKNPQQACNPVSEELNYWRHIQSIGQLLVALGGLIAFISLRKQIPLYFLQAQAIQKLTERVAVLESHTGCNRPDRPY